MAFVKRTEIDRIEIAEPYKNVQVRTQVWVEDDSVSPAEMVGGKGIERYVVNPGDDYSDKPSTVQAVCADLHTEEVIAMYRSFLSSADNTYAGTDPSQNGGV